VGTSIDDLFDQYDRRCVSRRQLIEGLLVLATPAMGFAQSSNAKSVVLQGATINHVSILVSDLDRSAEFYEEVFGARIRSERSDQAQLALANKACHLTLNLNRERPGTIDHVALGVERFDAVRALAAVRQRKPGTRLETDPAGFYVYDPDGTRVQVVSTDQ